MVYWILGIFTILVVFLASGCSIYYPTSYRVLLYQSNGIASIRNMRDYVRFPRGVLSILTQFRNIYKITMQLCKNRTSQQFYKGFCKYFLKIFFGIVYRLMHRLMMQRILPMCVLPKENK